ncbi:UDP-Glycosyltransferase/glycogen phosphorylase [Cubamyces menziesii]|nr:UDP-Glycosyltransferase/glycogen phosphorylase [Cubamyces menziesii]
MATDKHIVLVPMIMWGHTRPMCTFAARIVKLRPAMLVTMFVSEGFYERAKAEIALEFQSGQEHLQSRITLIRLTRATSPWDSATYEADFLDTWASFSGGQPLCGYDANGNSRQVDPSEKDRFSAAVIDIFAIGAFDTFRKIKESTGLKVYSWFPAALTCMFKWFGTDIIPTVREYASRTGVSFDVAAHEALVVPKGELVESPCLPKMYDYEYHPQAAFTSVEFTGHTVVHVNRVLRETDGLVTIDAADYITPRTSEAVRTWFGERPVYFAGPLVSPVRASPDAFAKPEAASIKRFLDDRMASHGAKSVMLISFGSMFWPTNAAKVGAVLNVLMEKNVPFILSRPTSAAQIPEDVTTKLAECENVYIANWVPQQLVLSHPATGWCLTHAGLNSTFECIFASVPMITWPIDADQPPNVINLTDELKVAYELLEGRDGYGLGMIHRTGVTPRGTISAVEDELRDVLVRAFGADGLAKRARLHELKAKLQKAWEVGGPAREGVETLLDGM